MSNGSPSRIEQIRRQALKDLDDTGLERASHEQRTLALLAHLTGVMEKHTSQSGFAVVIGPKAAAALGGSASIMAGAVTWVLKVFT